jgi:hypothetical protein
VVSQRYYSGQRFETNSFSNLQKARQLLVKQPESKGNLAQYTPMVLCNSCAAEKNLGLSVKTHSCDPKQVQQPPQPKEQESDDKVHPAFRKTRDGRGQVVEPQPTPPAQQPPSPPLSQSSPKPQLVASKDPPRTHKSKSYQTMSSRMLIPPQLQQQLRLLIRANHILHHHALVDAFGHISIRHPLNKDQYLIAAYDPGAPALVKSAQDFISYWVKDSSPVDPNAPQGYSERYGSPMYQLHVTIR